MSRPGLKVPEGADPVVIIDRPELQARWRRTAYSAATLVAWALWMYLWLPVITLVAWFMGYRRFVSEIVVPDGGMMLRAAIVYLLVILVLGLALIVWSRYNLQRFGGKDRRTPSPQVTKAELREYFGVSDEDLRLLQGAGAASVEYSAEGRVVTVRPSFREQRRAAASPQVSSGPIQRGTTGGS